MGDVTLTLGGIELDPDLDWPERRQARAAAYSVTPTLGGGVSIISSLVEKGQPITLQGGDNFGWMKTAAVGALRALANEPGAVYTLEVAYESTVETYSVVIVEFDARPLIPRIVPEIDDDHIVTMRLITV